MTFGIANMDPWKDVPGEIGIGPDGDQQGANRKANHSSRHRRERKTKSSQKDNVRSKEELEEKRDNYKRKADYAFRSGDYNKAISRYTRALELDPTNHVLLSNRSAAHLALGRPEKALEDARACVEACPNDCRGHSRLAVALQKLELWIPAIESYQRVLEIDPENQVAERGIEVCEMNMKEEEERSGELQDEHDDDSDNEKEKDLNEPLHDTFVGKSSFRQLRRPSTGSDLRDHLEYHRENGTLAFTDDVNHAHDRDFTTGSCGSGSNASGMSVLSKQLRVMQGTIQSQEDQIDRLNRQLQLVTNLKGTSRSELRATLEEACNDEAHAELVGQISSLRTQLSAMTLLGSSSGSCSQSGLFSSNNFERESYESTIASLELRVGELEEVEEALRKELAKLYRSLSDETCKASQLSSTCEFQKDQLVELMKNVTLVQKSGQQGKWSVVSNTGSTKTLQTVTTTTTDSEESVGTHSSHGDSKSLNDRLRNSELQLKMERDRAKLLEIQVEAREMEAQLQKKQYKSRVQFQEERIAELEHQLSTMHGQNTTRPMHVSEHGRSRINKFPLVVERSDKDEDTKAATNRTPLMDVSRSLHVLDSEKIASGYLLKRDQEGLIKGWKKRYFCLYQSLGTYQITYSDGPHQKVKGTIGSITTGVSTVSQTTEFPKHPFAFILHVNPNDKDAAVLYAAAASQDDLKKWLMALRNATKGSGQLQSFKPKTHPPVAVQLPKTKEQDEEIKRRQRLERLLQKYGDN